MSLYFFFCKYSVFKRFVSVLKFLKSHFAQILFKTGGRDGKGGRPQLVECGRMGNIILKKIRIITEKMQFYTDNQKKEPFTHNKVL
jgi:hypothetical protein